MAARTLLSCILLTIAVLVSACTTGRVVPKASKITLQDAMKAVGEGLKEMKTAQGDIKTGLLPSEVIVTFNVTASASDSTKLALTVSTPPMPQVPISGSATGEVSNAISAARGNVITVKFANILFAPKDQLITMKGAADIEAILEALKNQGITVYVAPDAAAQ